LQEELFFIALHELHMALT